MNDNKINDYYPFNQHQTSPINLNKLDDEFDLTEITTNLHKYNLFSILRHLELNQDISKPLIGETASPSQDLFRLYQNPLYVFYL